MSAVLDAIRQKYPQYAERSDADLTVAIGRKFPVYREQDAEFDQDFTAEASKAFRGPTESELALAAPRTPAGGQPTQEFTPPEDPRPLASQFWEDVNTPMLEIVKPLSEDEHKLLAQELTKGELRTIGMQESLGATVNFFTSPLGVSTLGISSLPKLAQRAVALAFTGAMASHAPDIAAELGAEYGKPEAERDQAKIGRLITDGAQLTGFTSLGAIGAGGGAVKPGLEWWRSPIEPVSMAKSLLESPIVAANRKAAIERAAQQGGAPLQAEPFPRTPPSASPEARAGTAPEVTQPVEPVAPARTISEPIAKAVVEKSVADILPQVAPETPIAEVAREPVPVAVESGVPKAQSPAQVVSDVPPQRAAEPPRVQPEQSALTPAPATEKVTKNPKVGEVFARLGDWEFALTRGALTERPDMYGVGIRRVGSTGEFESGGYGYNIKPEAVLERWVNKEIGRQGEEVSFHHPKAEKVWKQEGDRLANLEVERVAKETATREAFERKSRAWHEYSTAVKAVDLPPGKKGLIEVPSREGQKIALTGTAYGDWFISKSPSKYDQAPYKVTHAPSGFGVSGDGFATLAQAKDYVRALVHADIPTKWVAKDQIKAADLDRFRDVGKAWHAGGDAPSYFKPAKSGTSGMGFPMAAPVPPTPTPAAAPGVTMIQGARLPVTLPRTAPGSVSVPQIMQSMQNVLRTAGSQAGNIRTGHFFQRALGIWKPHEEIIRMADADNIPTATHEIGHGLQQKVYGTAFARGLKFLGPDIRRELVGLGKALYGGRKPAAGYSGEGFAEFMRYWITTEDAAKVAPRMNKFFEGVFLPNNPAIARSLHEARDLVSVWRSQGSVERASRQVVREPGAFARVGQALAHFGGYHPQLESGAPLEVVSKEAARKLGRPLPPAQDPFKLFSWKRGSAGATVERMATDHMLDVWGNPVGPSLAEALAPVKGQRQEFLLYVLGDVGQMRWRQGKNPGIAFEDAQYIKDLYRKPEMQIAAQKYYDWQNGLLDYLVQADPSMKETVDRIRAQNRDPQTGQVKYAPLARMIDPAKAKAAAAQAQSNPLMRMHGSGLPVKDIFDQTFINAARLVNRANRALVTNSLVKLSRIQGLGHIAEAIPRDRVAEKVNIELIRKQLEDMGVDTSAIGPDEILQYFALADMPKGSAPIVVVKDAAGKPHWYEIDPRVYDTLEGLQTYSLKQSFPGIPHLGQVLDLFLGTPARAFRLGTTGLRPAFSLVTNPTRDVATLIAQSSVNPAKVAAMYPAALKEAIAGGPYKNAFFDLGAHLGQPLGTDIAHTKRVSKELFHGRIMRTVRNPVDHLRELLSIPESAPRLAELRAVADEVGWKPGQVMTPDQAVQMALAAKRVTVDFSAAGDVSRILNQAIPFYNPALQGFRSFARAFKNNPTKATLTGLAVFTAPTLALWWLNKDTEWYRALPWRERYLYTHIDDGTNVWQIPRPFEWGNAFMVIPEAIMDSWYKQDPEAAKAALGHIFETSNPVDLPVLGKLAKEQWSNRVEFWDRPIVPRGEVDLPASEQVGPYTSRLAVGINKAFPELSPRRVDAAIRGYFGGAGGDVMQLMGIGSARLDREWEGSDFPVFGTIFRRGGQFNAQNQHINDFWETYLPSRSRVDGFYYARSQAAKGLRNPESIEMPAFADIAATQIGEDAGKAIRLLTQMAARTKETRARSELYRQAGEMARQATDAMRNARKGESR